MSLLFDGRPSPYAFLNPSTMARDLVTTLGFQTVASTAALSGRTLTPNFNNGCAFVVNLDSDLQVAAPTTGAADAGTPVTFIFKQDASGGHQPTWASAWGSVPAIDTTPNAYSFVRLVLNGDGTFGKPSDNVNRSSSLTLTDNASASSSSVSTAVVSSYGGRVRFNESGFSPYYPVTRFDVTKYGAVAGGVTDCLAGFNAAWAAANANGGGEIFIPKGVYRLTGQWRLGINFVNEADVIPGVSDYSAASSYNSGNAATALTYPLVSIRGEPGAVLWTDYAPSVDTAAVYYGIRSGSNLANDWHAVIEGFTIIGQAGMTAGVLNIIAGDDAVPGNQMGVFVAGASVSVRHVAVRECKRAGVLSGCYWAQHWDLSAWRCIDGWFFNGANASSAHNVRGHYAKGNGIMLSGQGVKVYGARTQQCAVDVWVVAGDTISVADAYLEDLLETGHTDYAVKWGVRAWQSGTAVYAASTTKGADYCWNDSGKTYVCIQSGTTAGSGGPTGTGSSITDNTAKWAYVGPTQGSGTNQVTYGTIYDSHSSKQYGRHMMLAGSVVVAVSTRFYDEGGGISKTWLDDTHSSVFRVNSSLPIDTSSPGGTGLLNNGAADVGYATLSTGGGLNVGNSGYAGLADGSGGFKLGSEYQWYDSTTGCLKYKHGSAPSAATDGQGINSLTNQVSLNFGSVSSGAVAQQDVTWSHLALGDTVVVSTKSAAVEDGVIFWAQVTSSTNVRVYAVNLTGGVWNVGARTYQVALWKQA